MKKRGDVAIKGSKTRENGQGQKRFLGRTSCFNDDETCRSSLGQPIEEFRNNTVISNGPSETVWCWLFCPSLTMECYRPVLPEPSFTREDYASLSRANSAMTEDAAEGDRAAAVALGIS